MDVRRFSRAVTTMKCTKMRDARAVSRFYDDPVIVAVVLACATEETKPLIWLSPSANQRKSLFWVPPVNQDLSTPHDWSVKKAIVELPIRMKENSRRASGN